VHHFLPKLHQFGLKRHRRYSPECLQQGGKPHDFYTHRICKTFVLYIYGVRWGLLGSYGSFPVAVLCSHPIFIPQVPTILMRHSDINYCSPWLACIFWLSPESALIFNCVATGSFDFHPFRGQQGGRTCSSSLLFILPSTPFAQCSLWMFSSRVSMQQSPFALLSPLIVVWNSMVVVGGRGAGKRLPNTPNVGDTASPYLLRVSAGEHLRRALAEKTSLNCFR
jgi:hypothetical protein